MADARAGTSYQVEPDFASRQAVLWSIGWLVGAVSVGVAVQARLLFPDLFSDLGPLSFGRLNAVFETTLVWGWLTVAGFGAVFAIVPRLAEAQLHNEVLGAATTLFWSLVLTAGVGTLLAGLNQGRPLAELPAGIDLWMFLMMGFVLYNAGVTAVRRRERTLYASAWFLLAGTILLPIVFVVGNLPVFTGLSDAIVSAWYVSAVEWYWLVPVGLGIAHFVIPIETGNPLHSTTLARITFWSLVFVGGWTGARVFADGATPDYLETVGVAMTVVLLVPVLSAASNLFATGRDRWGLLGQAYGLRFAVTGLGLLVVWTVLVAFSAVPQVSDLVGLTEWQQGLRHLALFGVFSPLAFAFIYRTYPLMIGRTWFSPGLSSFHFWATLGGVAVGTLAQLGSGVVQGVVWQTWSRTAGDGALAPVVRSLEISQSGFRWVAAVAFVVVAVAQYAFAWNAWRTSRQGPLVQVVYRGIPAEVAG